MSAPWIGIDVSKRSLDIVSLPDETSWTVPNDEAGWTALCRRLARAVPAGIVLEATGSYHQGVLLALAAAHMPAAVINPSWITAFGASEGIRKKTDRSDARMLARYGQQKQPPPTPLLSAVQQHLTALSGRRDDLVKMRVMEQNRRQVARAPLVCDSIDLIIAALSDQITQIEDTIARAIAADAELAARQRLLCSMPGVGPVTSTLLLCQLPELGVLDAKPLASLAGVAPHPRDSGTHHGHRSIRGGRPRIRKALYQAATTATQWNPVIRSQYQHLRTDQHCAHKVAVIACAHKMLRILSAMVRDNLLWSQTTAFQQTLPGTATLT